MAYELNRRRPWDDDEASPQRTLASSVPAAAPGQPSVPTASQSKGSGRYVNFQRYLNANADVSAREGGKVADKVEKAGAGAEAAIKGYETAGVAGTTPVSIPDTAKGGAPQAPGSYAGVKAQVESANQQVNMARGGVAQRGALATNEQVPNAGSRFDQALMGNAVGGRLHNAGQRYSGLSKMLSEAQGRVTAADAARQAAKEAEGVLGDPRNVAISAADASKMGIDQRNEEARAAALASRTPASETVSSLDYDTIASMDGLYGAWADAGKPMPYEDWKAQYLAGRE